MHWCPDTSFTLDILTALQKSAVKKSFQVKSLHLEHVFIHLKVISLNLSSKIHQFLNSIFENAGPSPLILHPLQDFIELVFSEPFI